MIFVVAAISAIGMAKCQIARIAPEYATPRDRDVITVLARRMIKDELFGRTTKTVIVLYWRNPEGLGSLSESGPSFLLSKPKPYPHDAWKNASRRNYDNLSMRTRPVLYTGRRFPNEIQIALNHKGMDSGIFERMDFDSLYPSAAGSLELLAPGYSVDGKSAMVVGKFSSPHGAYITASLKLKGGAWTVVWTEPIFFA
jgi:hypothetical protein